jgi:hypothetical protein
MSFRARTTRPHLAINTETLPLSTLQGHYHPPGKDQPQTTMPKANANLTAPGVATWPKPNALIKIRTARGAKANLFRLTSRASGTRTFRSYGIMLYTPITICMSTKTYLKRASNFLRKNWKPFWGHRRESFSLGLRKCSLSLSHPNEWECW